MKMNKAAKIMYIVLGAWILLYLFGMIGFLIEDAQGHEYGHAERIKEMPTGGRTSRIEYAVQCYAGHVEQNKILLYLDEDQDGTVEECASVWTEHGKLHYIRQIPDENGKCVCEGYIWLFNDSQGDK